MKFIISATLLFCSLSVFSQNIDSNFLSEAEQYRIYKKELYIDFMPKNIIPDPLKRNFYTDLSPLNFAQGIGIQTDSIKKIQKLYLTTQKAGAGFISINRNGLNDMDLASSLIYIYNNDTVKNDNQANILYGLKADAVRFVKYKRIIPGNTLVIKIEGN